LNENGTTVKFITQISIFHTKMFMGVIYKDNV